MPSLQQIENARKMRGETKKDFISQEEVDALLKGVTSESDAIISEDDWASAMASNNCDEHVDRDVDFLRNSTRNPIGWESINMPIDHWQKIAKLLESQPIGEFYEIYTRIISHLPRK